MRIKKQDTPELMKLREMIGQAIRNKRKADGVGLQPTSRAANISVPMLLNIELGRANYEINTLLSVLEVINMEIEIVNKNRGL